MMAAFPREGVWPAPGRGWPGPTAASRVTVSSPPPPTGSDMQGRVHSAKHPGSGPPLTRAAGGDRHALNFTSPLQGLALSVQVGLWDDICGMWPQRSFWAARAAALALGPAGHRRRRGPRAASPLFWSPRSMGSTGNHLSAPRPHLPGAVAAGVPEALRPGLQPHVHALFCRGQRTGLLPGVGPGPRRCGGPSGANHALQQAGGGGGEHSTGPGRRRGL